MTVSTIIIFLKLSSGKAFCTAHCQKVEDMGYPTNLREFLKSCDTQTDAVEPDSYTFSELIKTNGGTLNKSVTINRKSLKTSMIPLQYFEPDL